VLGCLSVIMSLRVEPNDEVNKFLLSMFSNTEKVEKKPIFDKLFSILMQFSDIPTTGDIEKWNLQRQTVLSEIFRLFGAIARKYKSFFW
jgi:hypothetical protein